MEQRSQSREALGSGSGIGGSRILAKPEVEVDFFLPPSLGESERRISLVFPAHLSVDDVKVK